VLSGRNAARLRLVALRWSPFREILRVGAVASLTSVQTNVTVALTTALAASFGTEAVAGYGTGARLEYLLVPLVFGLGGPLVAMVGTNIGAGQRAPVPRTCAWSDRSMAALAWAWHSTSPRKAPAGCFGPWSPGCCA